MGRKSTYSKKEIVRYKIFLSSSISS